MPRSKPLPRSTSGYTLIELLAVLAVSALLFLLATPRLVDWSNRLELRMVMHELAGAIQLVRSAALAHREVTTLCPRSADGPVCGENWSLGYVAFVDRNRNGRREHTEQLLDSATWSGDIDIRWRAFARRGQLMYTPRGYSYRMQNGSFTFCRNGIEPRDIRQIRINSPGRPRFSRDENNDGVHEDAAGNALVC